MIKKASLASRVPKASESAATVPSKGALASDAPVGASLKRVEKVTAVAEGQSRSSVRFLRADVPVGNKAAVVLDPRAHPEQVKASFTEWYGSHDAYHVVGGGFKSVAEEVLPTLQTMLTHGLIRCVRDKETGKLSVDYFAERLEPSVAEAAVSGIAAQIEALHTQDPTNSVYFAFAKPTYQTMASNPNALVAGVLSGALSVLEEAPERYSEKQQLELKAVRHDIGKYSLGILVEEVESFVAGKPSPELKRLVELFNDVGWPTDVAALLSIAEKPTAAMRAVFEHPEAQNINGTWLLPAKRDDPQRTQQLEDTLAQAKSIDTALASAGSIEWVELPKKPSSVE
jgi:hypothetical protein